MVCWTGKPISVATSETDSWQLQAFFLVSDDVMDSSVTRRGQPCWYKKPEVGLIAINDAFLLESAIYFLLKKHFKGETYYVDLLELFHDVTYQTEVGQLIDLITAPEDHVDLSKFSLDKYVASKQLISYFYIHQAPIDCHLQNRVLLVLPASCVGHVHWQDPSLLSIPYTISKLLQWD